MIWTAFGEVLPAALGIAISPIPIVLIILMLVSVKARVNGPAFLVGWIVGATAITTTGFLLADLGDAATDTGASDTVNWSQLLFGVLFMVLAIRQWRTRPAPGIEPAPPKLFSAVDGLGGGKALVFGLGSCVANPKNLPLAFTAGATLAQAGVSGGDAFWSIAMFVVVASTTVAAPVVVYLALGERADHVLAGWKAWLMANNNTVMMILFAILGAKMIGSGLGVAA